MNPLLAFAIAGVVAGAGWRLRALSTDGAVAAVLVGTSILGFTGWAGLVVLGTFFVGSTAVSRLASRMEPGSDQADTEIRNRWQVFANGGAAALGASAETIQSGLGFWLVSVSLAAAAGDTWATAFGRLSRKPPRDLLSRLPVVPGTSGGVTWFGTMGGLVGATLIGLVAGSISGVWSLYGAAAAIGFGSMLLDSALGSRWQARFHCPRCDVGTERRRHRCGTVTELKRGWRWLDNDAVNAVATTVAALIGLLVW